MMPRHKFLALIGSTGRGRREWVGTHEPDTLDHANVHEAGLRACSVSLVDSLTESLILAQDERWRRA